jgi:hypothetical protein
MDIDDVLEVPTLRDTLKPISSPFCQHDNFGGGFVSERDRVAISSIYFGSPDSSGATNKCQPGTEASKDILSSKDGLDDEVRFRAASV